MKKIIAILVAAVMCASVLAVVGNAATIAEGMATTSYSTVETKIAYYNNSTSAIWGGNKSDSADLSTVEGWNLGWGASSKAGSSLSTDNTLFITFLSGSYGDSGLDLNGFIINDCDKESSTFTVEKAKAAFTFYTNANGTAGWNNWKKIKVNATEKAVAEDGIVYWIFWFDKTYHTDALLVHFSTNYSGYKSTDMSNVYLDGQFVGGLYDSNGVHAAAGGDPGQGDTPVDPTPIVEDIHPDFVGMAMQQPTGERTTYPGPYSQSAIQGVHYNLYANFNNGVTAGGIKFNEDFDATTSGSVFADAKIYVTNNKWSEAQGSEWSLDGLTEVPAKHSMDGKTHIYTFSKAVNAKTIVIVWGGEADGGHLDFRTSNVTILEPSADTGDMLNVAIAVASVAILGTAAAIAMKRRKED